MAGAVFKGSGMARDLASLSDWQVKVLAYWSVIYGLWLVLAVVLTIPFLAVAPDALASVSLWLHEEGWKLQRIAAELRARKARRAR